MSLALLSVLTLVTGTSLNREKALDIRSLTDRLWRLSSVLCKGTLSKCLRLYRPHVVSGVYWLLFFPLMTLKKLKTLN